MPRIARAVAVGFTHQVIQKGNNKEKLFFEKENKQKYLWSAFMSNDLLCPVLKST